MGRFINANNLPFVVAIQALALLVFAFFQPPQVDTDTSSVGVGGETQNAPEALTSLSELPRDLQREKLPIPRFPDREKPKEPPVPTPDEQAPETTPGGEGSKLAALRVQNVTMTGPVAIAISAPMLGLPDSLDGQSLAGSNWLGGGSSTRRGAGRVGGGPSDMGGGGTGGQGIGGYGGGSGGHCPTPGRIGGGGRSAGGGGGVSGGRGRPAGGSGGGGATTGAPSGGSRGRPAGTTGGSRGGNGPKGKPGRKS